MARKRRPIQEDDGADKESEAAKPIAKRRLYGSGQLREIKIRGSDGVVVAIPAYHLLSAS